MKKIFGISLVVLSLVFTLTGCGCNKKEEEKKVETEYVDNKYNTNEGIIEDKTVGELKFTNTSLLTKENYSTLITLVTNPTDKAISVRIFNIYVKDKNGKTLVTLQGYVGGEIPAGESREITSNVDMSLANAHTVEYEIVND